MAKLPKYIIVKLKSNRKSTAVEIEDVRDADVVEPVRCKDCTFYDAKAKRCNDEKQHVRIWKPSDYCSRGKRRQSHA